jgi:hypothetical protein
MRILNRPEIEAHDDMARMMAFHDRLVNMRLLTLLHPKPDKEPLRLAFDNPVVITPLGDPISIQYSAWQLLDAKEKSFPWIDLPDLVGCPVTGIGYVQLSDWKKPAPYLQFINQVYLVCECPQGGCALRHDRPREDAWDVLPVLPNQNS